MNSKKGLSIKPLVILILALLTIVVEAFPEDSISKIDPMDHLRGRRLSESTRQLVRMCNSMAEMGLSYEAARLLKSASVYSKNKETSEEAKHILISWRINEMEINDANADSIRKKIRKTLIETVQHCLIINGYKLYLLLEESHKQLKSLLTLNKSSCSENPKSHNVAY